MAAARRVMELEFTEQELADLERVSRSRTEPASHVQRARILLGYRQTPSLYVTGRARTLFIPIYRASGSVPPPFRRGRGRTSASGSTPWSPSSTRRALSPARAVKIDGIRARTC